MGGALFLLLCISCPVMAVALTGTGPIAADNFSAFSPGNVTTDDVGIAATWDAACLGESIPHSMTVGESFLTSVTMQNTGTGTWTASKKIKLGAKSTPADMFGPKRVSTTVSVPPEGLRTYWFTITAPDSQGEYYLSYQMVKDGSHPTWFGETTPITGWVWVSGSSSANTLATNVVARTNTYRGGLLVPLPNYHRNLRLDALAAMHSWAMAKSHKLSHNRAGDGNFISRLADYPGSGENIAFVPSSNPGNLDSVANKMMHKWMDHDAGSDWRNRLNILDGEHFDAKTSNRQGHPYDWTDFGVGAAYGKCNIGGRLRNGWFVTMNFATP